MKSRAKKKCLVKYCRLVINQLKKVFRRSLSKTFKKHIQQIKDIESQFIKEYYLKVKQMNLLKKIKITILSFQLEVVFMGILVLNNTFYFI